MRRLTLCLFRFKGSSLFASTVLITGLLVLTGCTSIKLKLGSRIAIDKIPVASINASLPKGPGIAPGEKSPLLAVLTAQNGKTYRTEGEGQGNIMWKDLQVTTTGVTYNGKGTIALPEDPRASDGKTGHVTITVPNHPELHAELDVPFRYDRKYYANFSGSSGSSGFNGSDGTNGMDGTAGSLDPNHPSAGGAGSRGSDGTDGQRGGDGGKAPDVNIRATLRPGSRYLLQVSVTAAGKQKFFLIQPEAGSLTVAADGGPGGSGGKGGRGGRGGHGGIGSPNGSDGMSGLDGHDGPSGSDGQGGAITVIYSPEAKPFLTAIHLHNQGGPHPVFKEEDIPPLW